jgi:hypothetical protein
MAGWGSCPSYRREQKTPTLLLLVASRLPEWWSGGRTTFFFIQQTKEEGAHIGLVEGGWWNPSCWPIYFVGPATPLPKFLA